jgi:sugar phosphate isomerase/epimerase
MMIPQNQISLSDKALHRGSKTLTEELCNFRNHGVTHLHFSHVWTRPEAMSEEEVAQWEAALSESGLKVLDVHGCHPKDMNLWDEDAEARERAEELFRHRLELTARLGGDSVVYHVPVRIEPNPTVIERFVYHLARMVEIAQPLGLVIALENHYHTEADKRTLSACFDYFSPETVRFTFDPGHALISGNTDWLIANAFDRLHILHLNDNDGDRDLHRVPGEQGCGGDWNLICQAIAASPYRKTIQLEVWGDPEFYTDHDAFLRSSVAAGRKIAGQINDLRTAASR